MGELANQRESPTHLSPLADQVVVAQAKRLRLGVLKGQFSVPCDFDRTGHEEIADLFEGVSRD